jgi:NitT/TauT family transport system substrate-binding protein
MRTAREGARETMDDESHKPRRSRRGAVSAAAIAVLAVALATVAVGCGDDDEGNASAGGGAEATSLKVAYVPAVTYPYLWRAQKAGYFEDEGLDVELTPMAGGLEIIRAIEGGSIQFGGSDIMGAISAVNQGVPVKFVVAPTYATGKNPVDAVMTNDPSVQDPGDLEGKTLAVNLRFNIDWLLVREWLRSKDVDPEQVEITEIPFPDMPGAIGNRRVAAAAPLEPFVTISKNEGYRNLGFYWGEIADSILVSGIIGNTEFMDQNPETTTKFTRALEKAVDDISEDESISRQLLGEFTEIPAPVRREVNLPTFSTEDPQAAIDFWIELAKKEELIPEDAEPDLLADESGGQQ